MGSSGPQTSREGDLQGGQGIREVKWNDPEKRLLEFQEEVTEPFKK